MGCCKSVTTSKARVDFEEQYQSLMSAKPAPVNLDAIRQLGIGRGDVPEFDEVSSDGEAEDFPRKSIRH
jgi:hypothetical protein